MGDPRKLRKKYSTPTHPWQKLRIDEEKELMKSYGFKNKVELWKLNSKLRNFKSQVKKLIPKKDEASQKQKQELIKRLQNMNLIGENAVAENILEVTMIDMCERRLQTIVFKKGLGKSIKQARQFITHEHVIIGDRKVTSPSYLVTSGDEKTITFSKNSVLMSEDHPERVNKKAVPAKPVVEEAKEKPKTSKAPIKKETDDVVKDE